MSKHFGMANTRQIMQLTISVVIGSSHKECALQPVPTSMYFRHSYRANVSATRAVTFTTPPLYAQMIPAALTMVTTKIAVFWNVKPFSLVDTLSFRMNRSNELLDCTMAYPQTIGLHTRKPISL